MTDSSRAVLETFDNPRPDRPYTIEFSCSEFTSLCPKTGQADFATIVVRYVPGPRCVELKSLKQYFWSFREQGIFFESVTNQILDDLVDAWNKFPNVPIGSVWVRVDESGDVIVFTTLCPHLGCSVEYRNVETDFYCPCHLSAFKLDGTKDNPIPPRDMDSLAVKPDTGDEIWVQFKNFRGGISEKVEI